MIKYKHILSASILLMVPAFCSAAVVTSFESGTEEGWTPATDASITTSITSARASDGVYSFEASWTVATNMTGWYNGPSLLEIDSRTIMDASTTSLSVDVHSDWDNTQGWGVYRNTMMLILNYEGGYEMLDPTAGTLVNGDFSTLSWDMSSWASTVTDSGLSYSSAIFIWSIGTWADNGVENGTYTASFDNIQTVPEPTALSLFSLAGIGVFFARRRFKR